MTTPPLRMAVRFLQPDDRRCDSAAVNRWERRSFQTRLTSTGVTYQSTQGVLETLEYICETCRQNFGNIGDAAARAIAEVGHVVT